MIRTLVKNQNWAKATPWPGGFKNYINTVVNKSPQGQEALTDEKVFWINIY